MESVEAKAFLKHKALERGNFYACFMVEVASVTIDIVQLKRSHNYLGWWIIRRNLIRMVVRVCLSHGWDPDTIKRDLQCFFDLAAKPYEQLP